MAKSLTSAVGDSLMEKLDALPVISMYPLVLATTADRSGEELSVAKALPSIAATPDTRWPNVELQSGLTMRKLICPCVVALHLPFQR